MMPMRFGMLDVRGRNVGLLDLGQHGGAHQVQGRRDGFILGLVALVDRHLQLHQNGLVDALGLPLLRLQLDLLGQQLQAHRFRLLLLLLLLPVLRLLPLVDLPPCTAKPPAAREPADQLHAS